MDGNLQGPVAKWSMTLAVIGGLGVLLLFFARSAPTGGRGLPGDRQTQVMLTCVNPDCPGRTSDHVDPIDGKPTTAPHSFQKMIRGDFDDWPVRCDACGGQTAYLKVRTESGDYLIVQSLSEPSVLCPHCGRIVEVAGIHAGPSGGCPECGGSLNEGIWKAPQTQTRPAQ